MKVKREGKVVDENRRRNTKEKEGLVPIVTSMCKKIAHLIDRAAQDMVKYTPIRVK